MQPVSLNHRIKDLLNQIHEQEFSDSAQNLYRRHCRWIADYCEKNSMEALSLEKSGDFIGATLELHPNEDPLLLRRSWRVLTEFCDTGIFCWQRYHYASSILSDYYKQEHDLFEDYLHGQPLSDGSVENILRTIRHFFEYLKQNGCNSLEEMNLKHINGFIMMEAPTHQGNIGNVMWPIKRFLSYLNDRGRLPIEQIPQLPHPVCRRRKVLPCMSSDETTAILNGIDTSSPLGKRDYAIIITAARTGMRISDILSLRLSSIKWEDRKISFIKKKTGKENALPLFADVGDAIADYILNGRPHSDEPHIFLSSKAPHGPIKPGGNRTVIIHKYQRLAGIDRYPYDGKGFHAFRRTVGTNMVNAGVSIEKTSQILGHENLLAAKRYVSLDTSHLSDCCLDISVYRTTKEGLI